MRDAGPPKLRLLDGWVNPNLPATQVDPTVASLFPGLETLRFKGTTRDELIELMDEAGVERAVLCAGYRGADTTRWVLDAIEARPDRFAGSIVVDPRRGMEAVRELEHYVVDEGFVMARMMALETQLPYDHAYYFPIYAKCSELGIPVSLNVGIPGPRVPGRHQHPLALDEVCWFFPELSLVMTHGGDPWAELCVKLMAKWENLHYMTSAFAPSKIPPTILDYANGDGADRVMWASDFPILDFARCRSSILRMPFADEQRRQLYAHGNAARLLFGEATATETDEVAT